MHCRSFLLLDRELQHLEVEPLWGITVYRVPSAPLLCIAVLSGKLFLCIWPSSSACHLSLQVIQTFISLLRHPFTIA